MSKSLEQFVGGKTWDMVLVILRRKHCSVVLAKSTLGKVFLEETGFVWERKVSQSHAPIRIALKTPVGVFKAISRCGDRFAPKNHEIVKFVMSEVLEKLASKS